MQKVQSGRFTISGRGYELDATKIEHALRRLLPEPLRDHYVVVGMRRFPPKQVVAEVTGVDRADFTTNQARTILRRLGFPTGRLSATAREATVPYSASSEEWGHEEAERLRPFAGQWVVLKNGEVIISGEDPSELVGWLRRNSIKGDSLFRVPLDASVDMGGFPGG